ncbi:MAG TPA: hypothetical protein VG056_07580 [Pirellulales bacterium]|nr:hypothetical protein [Pirellulales bacterium]
MRRFAFRLCLALGCPHPDHLPLYADQFAEWREYYQLEPFGDDWRQTALLAFISARKGGARHCTIEDFMPTRKAERQQSDEQVSIMLHNYLLTISGAKSAQLIPQPE